MIQLEALRQAVVPHRTDYLYVLEVVNTFLKELTKCVVRARVWVLSQSRVCLLIRGYPKIYFLWSHSYCYLFVLAVMHIFFTFELRELKQEPKEISRKCSLLK